MSNKFPKETGGGWYELSNGSKVQGEDEANKAEAELGSNTADAGAGEDSGPVEGTTETERIDSGTGLESLAVDREGAKSTGGKIGEDEDDPRAGTPVQGMEVVGYAESGEPIVVGGVPTMTTGRGAKGTVDPTLGVARSTDAALARHDATRDEWGSIDPADSDGSPADRVKAGQSQNLLNAEIGEQTGDADESDAAKSNA